MLFSELFSRRPELLKSNEQLTFKEAVEHAGNLVEFLAEAARTDRASQAEGSQ